MTDQRIIWIASFPKSGNTWIRLLLAHYFLPKEASIDINSIYKFTTSDMRQDFFEKAHKSKIENLDLQQWLELRQKVIPLIARSKPNHHFVKTHSALTAVHGVPLIPPLYTAASVYLLRNPFDVALSYARHLSLDIDTTIDRMTSPNNINGSTIGIREIIGRWDTHVQTWMGAEGLQLKLIRYEDLLSDAEREVSTLLTFLGVPVDHGKLRRAVRKASFETLRKQEEQFGFRERPKGMEKFFVSGKSGRWKDDLTSGQIDRIATEFESILKEFYPEILLDLGKQGGT